MSRALPYSRRFRAGASTTVVVYIGTPGGWAAAKRDVAGGADDVLLLPAGGAPDQYRWPDLSDRSVYVVDDRSHADDTDAIARHVMAHGARDVLWSRRDDDVLYHRELVA